MPTPEPTPGDTSAPVRVVNVDIPNHVLSEDLFGRGIHVPRCQVVFRQMMPAPEQAVLGGVMGHGLVLTFDPAPVPDGDPSPNGLLVPWGQVSYLKFLRG